MTLPIYPNPIVARTWQGQWNDGVTVESIRTVAPTGLVVPVEYVTNQVLRVANEGGDNELIYRLIRTATEQAEVYTQRALIPQTWQLILSGFPASGRIVLPRLPVISVESFSYLDGDGESHTLSGSPAEYLIVTGKRVEVRPLVGESWPTSVYSVPNAVTITYRAGYQHVNQIPAEIITGICLMVGELYKQRTMSVHAVHNTPSVLQPERFWRQVY